MQKEGRQKNTCARIQPEDTPVETVEFPRVAEREQHEGKPTDARMARGRRDRCCAQLLPRAAVDADALAGEVAGRVGHDEAHCVGNFLG